MVELFLSKTEVNVTDSIKDVVKSRVLLLEKVEKLIWKILSSDGIYESRLWLCNTLSSIRFITPSDQRRLFMNLLRSKQSKRDVASQLLRMIFEKRPGRVGDFVVKKSNMLEKFFQGMFFSSNNNVALIHIKIYLIKKNILQKESIFFRIIKFKKSSFTVFFTYVHYQSYVMFLNWELQSQQRIDEKRFEYF